jgi:hypothetical protein
VLATPPPNPNPCVLCCAVLCFVTVCRLVEYLVVRYPVVVALGLFITVGGLLLAVFLGYQVSVSGVEGGGQGGG